MKKLVVSSLMVTALVMLFTTGALALSYDGGTFTPDVTLNSGNHIWFNSFSKPSSGSLETAILDLKFDHATPTTFLTLNIPPFGAIFTNNPIHRIPLTFSTMQNGLTSFSFTGNSLAALNSFITTSGVPIGLRMFNGSIELDSAHFYGTMKGSIAPEPISLALVAAGLVGLPFARRLKRVMRKEA
jgi:hypothetical protein